MITITQRQNCSGCHACAAVCPKVCITMKTDTEGFKYPSVDATRCINCGLCEKVCPIIHKTEREETPVAYAAVNLDEDIRENSSSGGVFYLLAEYVINQGGVVFGACFDENLRVVHDYAETMEAAKAFMGSKYVQSDMGMNYRKVREFLAEGRMVLFTGTPCQIGGLKSYLDRDYENLICQDIICHGVPSPLAWERYVQFREKQAGAKTRRTIFRHKKYGWKSYSVKLEFSNLTEYEEIHGADLFMRSFLRNLNLRPSCYQCDFKTMQREADITLADLWGAPEIVPELDDDKGTSLIVVHSEKGRQVIERLQDRMRIKPIDLDTAVAHNSAMVRSVSCHPKRDLFMKRIGKCRYDHVVNVCCGTTLLHRVVGFVKRTVKCDQTGDPV